MRIHRLNPEQKKQVEIDNLLLEKLNREIEIYLRKTEAIVEDICERKTLSQHMIVHLVCSLHTGLADINDPL
jgi:hypothetical protein